MQDNNPVEESGEHIDARDSQGFLYKPSGLVTQYYGYTYEQVMDLVSEIQRADRTPRFTGQAPYLGLAAYQESDAGLFFGREKLVRALLERLAGSRFVCLAGPSGSGKSSLARAGLIPELRQNAKWLVQVMNPGIRPRDQLARAVAALALRLGSAPGSWVDYLREKGQTDPAALHETVSLLLQDDPSRRVLLCIDQFEETFTQIEDPTEQAAFIHSLTTAVQAENARLTVLLILRSDFLTPCAAFPGLRRLMSQEFQLVGALAPDELARAIVLPAQRVGVEVEPELVAQVLADMKGEPGALPLMQFALKDLFEALGPRKSEPVRLTRAAYLERGGLQQALQRHADAVLNALDPGQKEIARHVFSGLVAVGGDAAVTRRPATSAGLRKPGAESQALDEVLEDLARARLITIDAPAGENEKKGTAETDRLINLSHERLIDAWPWLNQLVEENRQALAWVSRIEQDAAAWQENRQESSFLYRGARLSAAQAGLDGAGLPLSQLARDFVLAGVAQEVEETQRWKELYEQAEKDRQSAEEQNLLARSRELAAIANSQLEIDPERSLSIAIRACRISATFQAEDALRRALLESRVRLILDGHEAAVTQAQFSPDGRLILTASELHPLRVWDAGSGNLLATLGPYGTPGSFGRFSPDGKLVATGGEDSRLRIWEAATGKLVLDVTKYYGEIRTIDFSPNGSGVVTGHMDGRVAVWRVKDGEAILVEGMHRSEVVSARFSPDGRFLVAAGEFSGARIYDIATGGIRSLPLEEDVRIYQAFFTTDGEKVVVIGWSGGAWLFSVGGAQPVASFGISSIDLRPAYAQVSMDGRYALSKDINGIVRLWSVGQEAPIAALRGHTGSVFGALFSPDAKRIVAVGSDYSARIWDVPSGDQIALLRGHTQSVRQAGFSPDGNRLITASEDGTARVWLVGPIGEGPVLAGHRDRVRQANFSPDGQQVITASEDGTARLWDAHTGAEIARITESGGWISDARFSPDGSLVLVACWDKTARLWEAATGSERAVLRGHSRRINHACFSPDGRRLVTASDDGSARVWDSGQGAEIAVLRGDRSEVYHEVVKAYFSPDGERVVTSSKDRTARVWDIAGGKQIAEMECLGEVNSARFSPDGRQVITSSHLGVVQIWDAATGVPIYEMLGNLDNLHEARFSADGKRLVTAGWDGTSRLWDAATGRHLAALRGHEAEVWMIQYSPDGTRLVSASADGTARLWDALDGEELAVLRGHAGVVKSARFSPDGKRVVTAGEDGAARIFFVEIEDLLNLAARRVTRQLEAQERRKYLREDAHLP